MNYELDSKQNENQLSVWKSLQSLAPLIAQERTIFLYAILATFTTSAITLGAPLIIAYLLDTYIVKMQFSGVLPYVLLLLVLYLLSSVSNYLQIKLMGGVGQRVLFRLRDTVFSKLQSLPLAFFNANKAGDLISRINNDTDKLNQFFSQTLVQFVGSIVTMIGAAILIVGLNYKLGLAALGPVVVVVIFTLMVSPWVKRTNVAALKATGGLSAEVAESLQNFKVVVAFNRRDFFKARFAVANEANYLAATKASIATSTLTPIYSFAANVAQLIVLAYGISLMANGSLTLGLLVSYLAYVNSLYNPLRQIASLWGNFQVALAGFDRIASILKMQNTLEVIKTDTSPESSSRGLLCFDRVSFSYEAGKDILKNVSLTLEAGKTYALIGPTGGGKTTTASLMARLYDPKSGTVYLNGVDIRTISSEERTKEIGFILQEPILFSGTVRENILYGNQSLQNHTASELAKVIKEAGLEQLLNRFDGGLEATVATTGDSLSIGQKQIIAFMRTVIRAPKLIILDEATANIDTVTEGLLQDILSKLPKTTTRVVIAHRLNTIENADVIYFVNAGTVTKAGSMQEALALLQAGTQSS
jgi:ATP-binding cassette subfamily B protein